MRVCAHISCENNNKNRACLEANHIVYDSVNNSFLVFDIFTDDMAYLEVMRQVQGKCNFEKAVYSKEEMAKAEWFLMRSKCGKITSANNMYTFEYTCPVKNGRYHHQTQVREYVVNRRIPWKNKNNFYSTDDGDFQTIFCSEFVKKRFLENHVTGIAFAPVLWKKTMLPVDDLFQMKFSYPIPHEALVLPTNASVIRCNQCWKEQIYLPEPNNFTLGVHAGYLQKEIDAYITEDLFGEGFGYHFLIVSRKVYELINEMRERNIVFTPIAARVTDRSAPPNGKTP